MNQSEIDWPDAKASAHFHWPDETATERAGLAFAAALGAQTSQIRAGGLVVGLSGELGSGKTALVRATLRALGESGPVKSPTYGLLELYVVSSLNFYHFDFYRFKHPSEFEAAGFRELFGPGAICVIEWPERAFPAARVAAPDLLFRLHAAQPGRSVELDAFTDLGVACLRAMTAVPGNPAGQIDQSDRSDPAAPSVPAAPSPPTAPSTTQDLDPAP